MPLYPFIIRVFYLRFAGYAEGPFTDRKVGFNIFTKIPDAGVIAFRRYVVAVRPEYDKIRFNRLFKIIKIGYACYIKNILFKTL